MSSKTEKDPQDLSGLFIPEPRPHGFLTVDEAASALRVSRESLLDGSLDHSVANSIVTSDQVKWFNPIAVSEAATRLTRMRQAFAEGKQQATQRQREVWSAEGIRKMMKGKK
ncbi:MAG: hypothetical protein V4563_15840 [Pseudomonadota bacterium]